jgi:hypothetical protein
MRKTLSIIVGFLLSFLLLYLALHNISIQMIRVAYSTPTAVQMLVVLAMLVFMLFVRGWRWSLLVRPCSKAGAYTMFKLEAIGMALNNVLPLRLGEIARATIGAGMADAPFLTLLSTIVVERVLDSITLGIIFAIALQMGGSATLAAYGHWVLMLVITMALALGMLIFLEEMLEHSKMLRDLLAGFPRLDKFARQIAMGAQALRDWKLAIGIIMLGIPLWCTDAFGYYWAARILNITPAIHYVQGMILLCAAATSVAMPSMPGYFGPFELALKTVLVQWGVAPDPAVAYATFVHLNGYIVNTVVGIIFLYGAGHSLGSIWKHLSSGGKDAQKAG